jgi:hypothetical protein
MKRSIIALCLTALFLTGCAHPVKQGTMKYVPYGIANEQTKRDPNIKYEISAGSVVFAIVFFETIIAPVYIVGWDLYQPVVEKK